MKLYEYRLVYDYKYNHSYNIQMKEYEIKETPEYYYINSKRISKNNIEKLNLGRVYLLEPDLNKAKKILLPIIKYNINRYEKVIKTLKELQNLDYEQKMDYERE